MVNDPNQPRRPRTGIIITIVVILLIILGVYLFHKKPVEVNNQSTDNTTQTQSAPATTDQPNSTTDSTTDNSSNVNATPGSNTDNSNNLNSTPGSNTDNSNSLNSTPGSNPDNSNNVNATPGSNPDNSNNVNSTPGSNPDSTSSATPSSAMTSSQPNNGALPNPKPLSSFKLTDDQGKTFSNDNLKDRWTLLFFGFSRCGDVCPTTLTQLNKMMGQLQQNLPSKALPQVVMITVDPETDTTSVMHNYVKKFNPNFIGAVPDTQALDSFSKDLGMHYEKVPQGSNGYVMNHSADLYLINPEGNLVASFAYPRDDASLVQSYENIVKSNNQSK